MHRYFDLRLTILSYTLGLLIMMIIVLMKHSEKVMEGKPLTLYVADVKICLGEGIEIGILL